MINRKDSNQTVFAHVTIGLQLAITMIIFVYGGHRLDLYFDKSPVFLIVGTIIGMCLGFYHLLKDLDVGSKKDQYPKSEEEQNKKRIKWN